MNTAHTAQPSLHLTLPALPWHTAQDATREVFPTTKLQENLARYHREELGDVEPDQLCTTWAQLHMPVHGTTVDRALAILKDGSLHSYAQLQQVKQGPWRDNPRHLHR